MLIVVVCSEILSLSAGSMLTYLMPAYIFSGGGGQWTMTPADPRLFSFKEIQLLRVCEKLGLGCEVSDPLLVVSNGQLLELGGCEKSHSDLRSDHEKQHSFWSQKSWLFFETLVYLMFLLLFECLVPWKLVLYCLVFVWNVNIPNLRAILVISLYFKSFLVVSSRSYWYWCGSLSVVHVPVVPEFSLHSRSGHLSSRHQATEPAARPRVRCSQTLRFRQVRTDARPIRNSRIKHTARQMNCFQFSVLGALLITNSWDFLSIFLCCCENPGTSSPHAALLTKLTLFTRQFVVQVVRNIKCDVILVHIWLCFIAVQNSWSEGNPMCRISVHGTTELLNSSSVLQIILVR